MAGRRSSALVLLACVTLAACGGGGGGGGGPGGGGGNGVLLASVTTGTFLGVDPLSGEGTRISAVGLTGFRSVSIRNASVRWQTIWCAVIRPHWRGLSGLNARSRRRSSSLSVGRERDFMVPQEPWNRALPSQKPFASRLKECRERTLAASFGVREE